MPSPSDVGPSCKGVVTYHGSIPLGELLPGSFTFSFVYILPVFMIWTSTLCTFVTFGSLMLICV